MSLDRFNSCKVPPPLIFKYKNLMCVSIPTASIPPPPWANPGHLIHDESRGLGICQIIVCSPPPPVICKQQKHCFVTFCHHFQQRSEVKGFQPRHFGKRSFKDPKRPSKAMKTFALSLFGQSVSFRDLIIAVTCIRS